MRWNNNLLSFLGGGARRQELSQTRKSWQEVEARWRASPFGAQAPDATQFVLDMIWEARDRFGRTPRSSILVEFCIAIERILYLEDVEPLEADWSLIESDISVAVEVRRMLTRRRRWATDYNRLLPAFREPLIAWCVAMFERLPEGAFTEHAGDALFEVRLLDLLEDPVEAVQLCLDTPYTDETLGYGLFERLREHLVTRIMVASGFSPEADLSDVVEKLKRPDMLKGKTPDELVDLYLDHTPFAGVLRLPVPFSVPESARFEHAHIVGGTGHGKTQLLQRMIHADLVAAQTDTRSVVVIDSQGDLINKLVRLDLFSRDTENSLFDRLVLIDPTDIEYPFSLNLFDAHTERIEGYRPVDRERVLNGVIELYETFFGALLGAELTQKQGVIFRYLARLMLTIPDATIHTLMELMDDGKPFRPYMEKLDGSARYFFEREFFHPSFSATKKQILKRLWGVLSTPAFERMFAQRRNKLDLYTALNSGKIILVNTAKDLLKEEGSAVFGRFFISMLSQAALERSTIPESERTPTFVYVDEAQEYFDDRIETILSQARKYRVSMTLAHQTLDQLSPRLRAGFLSNSSLKCAGGVSNRDARALAPELHTTPDFIESMRRRKDTTEFAVWLKNETQQALRLSVPLGFLERQPIASEEALEALLAHNRARYCGALDEVLSLGGDRRTSWQEADEAPDLEVVDAANQPPPFEAIQPSPPMPRPAIAPMPTPKRETGKGGSQHRYVQHVIKELAEAKGFRAVVEESTPDGQIDVALYHGDTRIACEVSVGNTAAYEAGNLAKCLAAGFSNVWAVAADAKQLRAIEASARERLSEAELASVSFWTPDQLDDALEAHSQPPDAATTSVRGYRVKVSRTKVEPGEARDRRAMVARIIAQSSRRLSA
jgi:hypothetical protein